VTDYRRMVLALINGELKPVIGSRRVRNENEATLRAATIRAPEFTRVRLRNLSRPQSNKNNSKASQRAIDLRHKKLSGV
jgi:hypothetical protein